MAQVVVKEGIAVAPEKVWRLVADFGNAGWIPGGDRARTEGKGPGMVRIFGGGNAEIRERLESVDEHARRIVYTIPQGIPFPIKDYRATMTVHPSAGGESELEWMCTFVPDGATEADAKAQVENLYKMMIGWIREYLAK